MGPPLHEAYDVIVFDCDGVLWSGGETIGGSRETLEALEASGKRIYFMSNNSSRGMGEFKALFAKHGLGAFVEDESRVWNSVTATRRWLEERGGGGAAYVVGTAALKEAVAATGTRLVEPTPLRGAAPDVPADAPIESAKQFARDWAEAAEAHASEDGRPRVRLIIFTGMSLHGFREPYCTHERAWRASRAIVDAFRPVAGVDVADGFRITEARPDGAVDGMHYGDGANFAFAAAVFHHLCT